MKLNKLFFASLFLGAIAFTACETVNPVDGPGNNPVDTSKVTPQPQDTLPVVADTTGVITCAAAAALPEGSTVKVIGYVTFAYNTSKGEQSAWLADDANAASGVVEAYYLTLPGDSVGKGDKVLAEGTIKHYTNKSGETVVEIVKPGNMYVLEKAEPVVVDLENDGSEEKPFTVAEVIELNNSLSGSYYIVGYIVGQSKAGSTSLDPEFEAPFSATDAGVNTNLLIAASAEGATADNVVPVQLPSGALRNGLNLPQNGDMLGKEIIIYGSLEKYFGKAGIKSPSYAKVGDKGFGNKPGEVISTTDGGTITIAEFITKEDNDKVWYTLTGTVSNIANTKYGNFDLTDATGTVYVYGLTATQKTDLNNDQSFSSLGIAEGDNITICGPKTTYNGKAEVKCAYFIKKN